MIEIRINCETVEEAHDDMRMLLHGQQCITDAPTREPRRKPSIPTPAPETTTVQEPVTEPAPEHIVNPNELDSAGRPWDARINTIKQTQTTVGIWKLKRGSDKAIVDSIYAEYDAKSADTPATTEPQEAAPAVTTDPTIITPESVQQKLAELMGSGKMQATDMMQLLADNGIPNMQLLGEHPGALPVIMAKLNEY